MKAFMLATCLLIVAEVYAVDLEKVKVFRDTMTTCEKNIGVKPLIPPALRPDIMFCVLEKLGAIDEYGQYDKSQIPRLCTDLTVDEKTCQKMIIPCIEKEEHLFSKYYPKQHNFRASMDIIVCGLLAGTMSLVP